MSVDHLRITSIGQGDPAMMPVRSDDRSKLREIGMVEFGDKHRRHAVKRRATLGFDRLQRRQRIKALARIDHRRAMRKAAEIADHHAEAMIERHRNAQPVALGEPDRLAHEETVVEDVVVQSVAPFGNPVVPLVNWMLIGSSNCSFAPSAASRLR